MRYTLMLAIAAILLASMILLYRTVIGGYRISDDVEGQPTVVVVP